MAELAACNGCRQREIRNRDLLVDEFVRKVICPLRHRTDEDADTLILVQFLHVLPNFHNGRIKRQRDLAAVRRQVVGDRVLDNLQELFLGVCGADGQAVQQLHHQTREALECARDADGGGDFDKYAFGGGDIDLEEAGFVDWGVEEGKETLQSCALAFIPDAGRGDRARRRNIPGA